MSDDRRYALIGTAGHIDHGKTALVKMLTGCETDTLKEEKERGLTIDLGFAPCELRGDLLACIVDVPGHEKFIRNMVAGASGIDAVLLVVAADDSVMPQTIEHLHIVELLGISRGLVAVTKIDMVDEELRDLVVEEVGEFLEGTFLEGAPVCPVSSVTGEGFEALWLALTDCVDSIVDRPATGVFRMPVERTFSPAGFGTVMTGMPFSGRVEVGDNLELVPPMEKGRLRGLQVYGRDSGTGWAGQCLAMNVTGVDHNRVERGNILATPGYLGPAKMAELTLSMLPGADRPLKHQAPVRLHIGTAELMGRMFLLDRDHLAPGETALAQFRSDDEFVVGAGDRFVIRQYSPVVTIGGGRILRARNRKAKRFKDGLIAELSSLAEVLDDPCAHVGWVLEQAGERPIREEEIRRQALLTPDQLGGILDELVSKGAALAVGTGGAFVSGKALASAGEKLKAALGAHHEANPLRKGMEPVALRESVDTDSDLAAAMLERLVAGGAIVREEGLVRLKSHDVAASAEQEAAAEKVAGLLAEAGVSPPKAGTLAEQAGLPPADLAPILDMLADRGSILKLEEGVYAHADAAARAKDLLVGWLREKGQIGVIDFRDLIGTTRKYVYVWLDHFDRTGVTYRAENLRYLAETADS
ncbi:MAG: selenocysteine-specific translation elongation factor [Planctomycetota bacterium]